MTIPARCRAPQSTGAPSPDEIAGAHETAFAAGAYIETLAEHGYRRDIGAINGSDGYWYFVAVKVPPKSGRLRHALCRLLSALLYRLTGF